MSEAVTWDESGSRFTIDADGELAGRLDYETGDDGALVLLHTIVEPEHQGKGVAGRLVAGALERIRAEDRRIVPKCPYVVSWLEKHPEYGDLVA